MVRDVYEYSRRELKHKAQYEILHALSDLGTRLSESGEFYGWSEEEKCEFDTILEQQKDRVARLFGYNKFPRIGY